MLLVGCLYGVTSERKSVEGLGMHLAWRREGKPLNNVGINARNRTHLYYSTVKRCRACSQKSRCMRGKYRTIAIHTCEPAR